MKAYKTGTWSKEDEDFLIENYEKMTVKEISKHTNRSDIQIRNKVRNLRAKGYELESNKKGMEEEYNFIRDNIDKTAVEIAMLLNTSASRLYPKIREVKKEPEIVAKLKEIEKLKQEKAIERNRNRARERYWRQIGREINWEEERARKKKEAKRLQIMYNKLISEPVQEGVFKNNLKVKLGQSYEVERMGIAHRDDWLKFRGELIQETKDHITIKNKTRAESFLKVDFLINEYRIKEVS